MSGCRGNVEAPPVWWGYCCRVGLSPVALRGLRGRWFCILSKSRTAAQHGGRFRLLSGGAGGWIAPGRSALGGWAACSVYYDLGGKFAPIAAPLLSLPLPPPLLWTLSRDRSGRWGWVGLDRLHGLRLVVWLVCWPGLAAGGVAGWGCCGSGGGLPAPLLLRRSCSPAGLPLCLYGRGLLRAAVWPCSCWPAAWRCRLRWAGWALGWHDPAGLVGWGAGGSSSSYCTIFHLVFRHFSPLSVRLATHKMIDKYP